MIELISAAKVDKISETDVSLPEKVVSNQENARNLSLGRRSSFTSGDQIYRNL
jgi:hypothetical protein